MATYSCIWWILSLTQILSVRWKFAKADVPIYEICALQNYNYFNLTAVTWALSLEPDQCLPLPSNNKSACELSMSFCHKLPTKIPCEDSSICQHNSEKGFLSLGAYSENPFSSQVPLPNGIDGFHTYFYNGSVYTTITKTKCKLQTSIAFECNPLAVWTFPKFARVSDVIPARTPKDLHYDNTTCQMRITFDYAGACKMEHGDENYLSIGTVLIIIFFITMFLYIILGALHNAFKGYTGTQLVPHIQFWTSLPGYIKDGCLFAICCRPPSGTDSYSQI